MERFWDSTKVFLMPNIWCDAWGLCIIDAQIRGIPVIASNVEVIPEPELNMPDIFPTGHYNGEYNEKGPIIPEQDLESLVGALDLLMLGQQDYSQIPTIDRELTVS